MIRRLRILTLIPEFNFFWRRFLSPTTWTSYFDSDSRLQFRSLKFSDSDFKVQFFDSNCQLRIQGSLFSDFDSKLQLLSSTFLDSDSPLQLRGSIFLTSTPDFVFRVKLSSTPTPEFSFFRLWLLNSTLYAFSVTLFYTFFFPIKLRILKKVTFRTYEIFIPIIWLKLS